VPIILVKKFFRVFQKIFCAKKIGKLIAARPGKNSTLIENTMQNIELYYKNRFLKNFTGKIQIQNWRKK